MAGEKNSTDASHNVAAIRIRDNQRRSRARRKEYVENLERKVKEYEKQGVGATLEMQHAARSVALENARLRMMLARAGATEADIEAFLQACQDREAAEALSSVSLRPMHHAPQEQKPGSTKMGGGGIGEALPRTRVDANAAQPASRQEPEDVHARSAASLMCDLSVRAETAYFAPKPESKPLASSHQPGMARFDSRHAYGLYTGFSSTTSTPALTPGSSSSSSSGSSSSSSFDKLDVLASATLQQGSCCEAKTQRTMSNPLPTPASEAPTSPSTVEPSTGAVTPLSSYAHELSPGASTAVQDFSSPMEMSCNAAAAIIAEMQGHNDRDMTKSRLGCRGRNDCFVKNAMLFHILDGEGGSQRYS